MASNGIADRVAIVGMGCTRFGERFDESAESLMVDAATECFDSVPGLGKGDLDAAWLGTLISGLTGMPLAKAIKLDRKPITRVENFCATGSEAFRNACYAVAAGAYDRVMVMGVEKLKDAGYHGLDVPGPPHDGTLSWLTAPAMFSLLVPAYQRKYGVDDDTMREALTHIAWKNHHNGAKNPRAQFRSEVSPDAITCSEKVAGSLGIFDCSGVADGAAAAIVVRAEDAYRYTDRPIYIKALSLAVGDGTGARHPDYDYTSFAEVVASAEDAFAQAGVRDVRTEISMAEVHDCFTPTELVLMEDLGFSERGGAIKDVLSGAFDLDGELPVNPDGGLKAFGHPIGATGLRMLFECWLQLRGEAGERQIDSPRLGLTHNLGGVPGECVSFVSVVGTERG
jgi:acetyl-CoA C-acetyltransferase